MVVVSTLLFFANSTHAAQLASEDIAGAVLMPSFEKGVKVETFARMLCDIHARSYIILRSDTSKQLVDSVQTSYEKQCEAARAKREGRDKVRLVVALDAEPSLMKYRMPAAVKTYKLKDTNKLLTDADVVQSARDISKALREAGIRINFAPIYDTGPNKAIIGNRAFSTIIPNDAPKEAGVPGTDGGQAEATRKAQLFMAESSKAGIITSAKHFPGHGHAVGDTHKTLESISAVLPELPNFVASIHNNVPMVMVGHLVVEDRRTEEQKMLEKREVFESEGLPATLSKRIMTDLLRTKLGYTGVVITDSMAMGALKGQADRSVRSLEAGADIILIPPDPRSAYARIVQKMTQDKGFSEKMKKKASRVLDFYLNK
jgi:beta-N-acetylhexosaminidase